MGLTKQLTTPCTLPSADYAQYAIDLSKLWGELLWTMTTRAASHGELVALVFGAYCAKHAIRHSACLGKTLISSLRQRTI